MELVFQIISGVLTVLAIFQKQKWKMLGIFTVNNLMLCFMYLAFGRTTSAFVMIVAMLRTLIFMIYAIKKIKPNWVWLIIFELAFIGITILTWQDTKDLMLMFAFLVIGYGSWQNNGVVLRISYIIGYTLSTIYKGVIGAYISMSFEIMSLTSTMICFFYYEICKKTEPLLSKCLSIFKLKKDNKAEQEIKNEEN